METVRIHPDDIKALVENFGTKFQTPNVPHENGYIRRGLRSIILGGSIQNAGRQFQIQPLAMNEPDPKVTLQVVGYSCITDAELFDAFLWLVEVNEAITGTVQGIAVGEFCLPPDQMKEAYPSMAELSDKYVRTIGPIMPGGTGLWVPTEGNAGLLEKGHGLAVCKGAARNNTACLSGIVVVRDYNTR